ncbi:MAG: polysaccharide biosynthesis protein, partial [Acholeplasmataceae bacterium]
LDLAERMIRLAGYIPYKDIDIKITGLRPGEKLFEELLIDTNSDRHKRTDNEKIFIEHESHLSTEVLNMSYISKNIDTLTNEDAVSLVKSIIKTYDPENGQEIKK